MIFLLGKFQSQIKVTKSDEANHQFFQSRANIFHWNEVHSFQEMQYLDENDWRFLAITTIY